MRCTDDFADCTQAIDGASELFYELYDDAGLAARMAIGAKVLEVTGAGVVMEDADRNRHEIPADTVVVSIGYESGTPFDTDKENVHVIGDAKKVGNLCGAILAANKLVISL